MCILWISCILPLYFTYNLWNFDVVSRIMGCVNFNKAKFRNFVAPALEILAGFAQEGAEFLLNKFKLYLQLFWH